VNIGSQFHHKIVVGRCIYCGTTDEPLYKEHIVPYSLGGSWVLHKASCPKCEAITREFEHCVTSEQVLVIRTVENLPTRRKEKRPKTLPLKVTKTGREENIECPIDMYPMMLILELYLPPAYIDKRPYRRGIGIRGTGHVYKSEKVFQRLREAFQIDACSTRIVLQGLKQARCWHDYGGCLDYHRCA
jgi:hypothetical protein